MKILFVARYFAPENTIGAVRMVKLAKYLHRLGHEVTVYAMKPRVDVEDALLREDAQALTHIYRLGNGRFYTAVHDFFAKRDSTGGGKTATPEQARQTGRVQRLKKGILTAMYRIMHLWSDWDFYRQYRRFTREDAAHYDLVFSSWSTDSAHRIARDMKRRGRAAYWIADFRDACVSVWPSLTKNRDTEHLLNMVYREADLVTVAFPSLLTDNHVPESVRSAVLFNGFDPEDAERIESTAAADGCFHLAYCGQIYAGHQDFTPLFETLYDLSRAGRIDLSRIVIDYAGQSGAEFVRQCAYETVRERIRIHGFVPREKALSIQMQAQLLLFACWNSASAPAIFPAKFLEYMMMAKPVLALIAGELANSEPRCVMDETGLGFYADLETRGALPDYLAEQFDRYTRGEPLLFTLNAEAIARFSYPIRARELEEHMLELMEG